MSAKYTLASSTTAGDRLLYVGAASKQLSTGDLVELVRDPTVADPNSITLQLVPGPAHTSPQVIATLNASVATSGSFLLANAAAQTFALCVDGSDNIFVFAQQGSTLKMAFQGFSKTPGVLAWTPTPASAAGSMSPSLYVIGLAATWCNTGGGTNGAGHILVIANTNSAQSGAYIFDAGAILAHSGTYCTQVTTNPAFLGGGVLATAGSNLDLDNDGFGATSGLAISAVTANSAQIGAWGVSSGGILTTGGGLLAPITTGTLSATTKLRIVRPPSTPNFWVGVWPSQYTATHLTVCSLNAQTTTGTSSVDTATTSNFPTPSATLSWDVSVDAMGTAWVYAWSSATATTMLRVPVTFPAGTATLGAVVSDDTAVGSGAGNTTIRTVKSPIDFLHVDWQTYDVVSPYSLIGDFSSLPAPPNTPVQIAPLNGVALALSSVGGFFDWTFSSPNLGDVQTAFYYRRQVSGGLYQWPTGSPPGTTWTTGQAAPTGGAEVSVTSAITSVTLPTTGWVANTTYSWAIAVTGSGGQSPYSSAQTVYSGGAQPSTPTLAATYDAINNRVQLVVSGTGTDNIVLNSSDDGGITWVQIRASPFALVAGAGTVWDYEAPPGALRLYQAAQNDPTQGAYSVQSAFCSSVSCVVPSLNANWIRDPTALTSGIQVLLKPTTFAPEYDESETEYLGLGRADKIVISDVMSLQSGAATFESLAVADAAALQALLLLQKTLLWQTQDNQNLYVRFYGVRGPWNQPTPLRPGSYREYPVIWVGQFRP